MSAVFVDVDGTIFEWGTLKPIPGAMERLRIWQDMGHQIIITTQRTDIDRIEKALKKLRVFPGIVIGNIRNPRVVINDMGAYAIEVETGRPWWDMPPQVWEGQ